MNSVSETVKSMQVKSEQIVNTDDHCLENMEVLDEFRQGDLRVIRLPDNFVKENSSILKETQPFSQLVVGSTQGSMHCLSNTSCVKMYALTNPNVLDGPIVEVLSPVDITHPEHGNITGLPCGIYAFPGQREYAEDLRRARD